MMAEANAASGAELHSKFVAEGTGRRLSFGDLSRFFGGLEGLVGAPSPKLVEALQSDHCAQPDSQAHLLTSLFSLHFFSIVLLCLSLPALILS